jgi:hypothetical protein
MVRCQIGPTTFSSVAFHPNGNTLHRIASRRVASQPSRVLHLHQIAHRKPSSHHHKSRIPFFFFSTPKTKLPFSPATLVNIKLLSHRRPSHVASSRNIVRVHVHPCSSSLSSLLSISAFSFLINPLPAPVQSPHLPLTERLWCFLSLRGPPCSFHPLRCAHRLSTVRLDGVPSQAR